MSRRFRIVFSCACAIAAALLFVAYANRVREEAERVRLDALERYGGEVVTLAVARSALEPGDVISSSNVVMREWLADLAPEGAVTSLDEVVGREVSAPLSKGAPLTEVTFRSSSEIAEVPLGYVAVTLPLTDKLGVPRSVAVGSTLAAYLVTSDGAELISEGMSVLASPGAASSLASSLQMTVAISSEDVPRVLTAAATNDLRLVMPAKDVGVDELSLDALAPVELDADAISDGEASIDEGPASPGAARQDEGEAASNMDVEARIDEAHEQAEE